MLPLHDRGGVYARSIDKLRRISTHGITHGVQSALDHAVIIVAAGIPRYQPAFALILRFHAGIPVGYTNNALRSRHEDPRVDAGLDIAVHVGHGAVAACSQPRTQSLTASGNRIAHADQCKAFRLAQSPDRLGIG